MERMHCGSYISVKYLLEGRLRFKDTSSGHQPQRNRPITAALFLPPQIKLCQCSCYKPLFPGVYNWAVKMHLTLNLGPQRPDLCITFCIFLYNHRYPQRHTYWTCMKAHAGTKALKLAINRDRFGVILWEYKTKLSLLLYVRCYALEFPVCHYYISDCPLHLMKNFSAFQILEMAFSDFLKYPLPSVMWQIVFFNFPKMAVVISPIPHALPEPFLLRPIKRWSLPFP